MFTTEVAAYPKMVHIGEDKDFTPVIRKALELGGYETDMAFTGINGGSNELPLSMVLSRYEQKAVAILLTLLHLGIKNILLGPSLPAFVSPNILKFLVENYNIKPISTPQEDLRSIHG